MAESSPNPSEDQNAEEPSAESADAQNSSSPDAASGEASSTDEEALRAAGQSAREISDEAMSAVQGAQDAKGGQPLNLPEFSNGHAAERASGELSLLNDINLNVTVELGRTRMYVEDVLRLNENSVVELEKAAGDPVDIFVNNRHVARGEVLVLNENFCVRISEIVKQPTGEE